MLLQRLNPRELPPTGTDASPMHSEHRPKDPDAHPSCANWRCKRGSDTPVTLRLGTSGGGGGVGDLGMESEEVAKVSKGGVGHKLAEIDLRELGCGRQPVPMQLLYAAEPASRSRANPAGPAPEFVSRLLCFGTRDAHVRPTPSSVRWTPALGRPRPRTLGTSSRSP